MGEGGGFLGVERSLTGRRWRQRLADDRVGLALAQRLSVPEILGRVLAGRGVDADTAERFLSPRLREQLPDPSGFKDMDVAVARLVRAVKDSELIAIFGDYDVDGATSAALLRRFLESAGARVMVYVPDRLSEGYGPNAPALLKLQSEGVTLAVTVDCGITAHAPLATAAAAGLDVVVVDHHVGEPELPRAVAVVNPNRLDEQNPHGMLAAVGVAFLLAVGLNRALRQEGWYATRPEPDLLRLLDLVALGTICDVVPLTGINRALVVQGLKVMRRLGNLGMAALAEVAGVSERLDTYHAGFILGPRVNAGGRVGRADAGTRLLTTEHASEARALAQALDQWNAERREIEARTLEEAIEQIERAQTSLPIAFVAREGWHPGVIGIVAGRLKDRYNRPACVVALADGIGKGSGRSVSGFALGPAVIAARQAGLLLNGGGHAMAAGFTVSESRVEAFRDFLAERVHLVVGANGLVPELGLDGALMPGAATPDFVTLLERLAPFGAGNAEPRFAFPSMVVHRADVVGESHVRAILGEAAGPQRLKAIAFRTLDTELGRTLLDGRGRGFHVAGHLRRDGWQGRTDVQLLIDDAAVA
ncbi:MAG TPA: single-stranded-DNA-specific exonuclease RecJ [Stellaceae bacterium]|jgi:single-stranded-DNA-specific exonuclease|nr:single-stranded-DNA-specific exonuclease RecJ [Stellaceae bacterium]